MSRNTRHKTAEKGSEREMILVKAEKEHIPALVEISKKAFDSDITVGASGVGGPPDYDSEEWHIKMMEEGHLFTAIDGERIVGGILVFGDENNASFLYVGRIFVDPDLFRKGYGIRIMEQIERMNPAVTTWCLDTPIWNQRTNRFYPKIGYVEKGRDAETVYYQKTVEK